MTMAATIDNARELCAAEDAMQQRHSAGLDATTGARSAQRTRIHMHPAKRHFLLVMVVGSAFGAAVLLATILFVATPMTHWHESSLATESRFSRLDTQFERLRVQSNETRTRMRDLMQQVRKVRAVATTRTAQVEKAAAESYGEHAKRRLNEFHLLMKEAMLMQESYRRQFDTAGRNATREGLFEVVGDSDTHEEHIENTSDSLQEVRVAVSEVSGSVQTMKGKAAPEIVKSTSPQKKQFTAPAPVTTPRNNKQSVLHVMIGSVFCAWIALVFLDREARDASIILKMKTGLVSLFGSCVVVEPVELPGAELVTDETITESTGSTPYMEPTKRRRLATPTPLSSPFPVGIRISSRR